MNKLELYLLCINFSYKFLYTFIKFHQRIKNNLNGKYKLTTFCSTVLANFHTSIIKWLRKLLHNLSETHTIV